MTNFIKSCFISTYVTLLLIASIHSGLQLIESGFDWVWVAILLSVTPSLGFFIRLFAFPVARTSSNLYPLIVCAAIGFILSLGLSDNETERLYSLGYSFGVGLLGSLLYVFWYSRLGRTKNIQLETGSQLPDFQLKHDNGQDWLSNQNNKTPSLFLFFRGNWCPLCMAQIKEIAKLYNKLEDMGVSVYLVSPQPEKHTRSLAKKYDVNYHFMVDENNQAAKQLGIEAKQGTPKGMEVLGYDSDTVLPTAILTDSNGKIIYTDQTDNYRVRPEPETFINIFEQYGVLK